MPTFSASASTEPSATETVTHTGAGVRPRGGHQVLLLACLAALAATGLAVAPARAAVKAVRHSAGTGTLGPLLVEPSRLGSAAGMGPVYSFVLSARHSVDMTMYELTDPTMVSDLVADARRGVHVRVILDTNREHDSNEAAFAALRAGGVSVVWADTAYEATHQKTITVDHSVSLILTGNLTAEYYETTRDFAVFDSRPADVAAIEAVFDADFAHRSVTPEDGADLVWSPGSQPKMLAVIDGARHTLSVENEEMDSYAVVSALAAAARRGVRVEITMTADSDYYDYLSTLVSDGAHVHLYADAYSDLYIHAKTTIADAGFSDRRAYVGSINFSSASMDYNRELGIITGSAPIVAALSAVVSNDYRDCDTATDCRNFS